MTAFTFLETICFKEGHYHLLEYHQQRLKLTYENNYFNHCPFVLDQILPDLNGKRGSIKVRFSYNRYNYSLDYQEYIPQRVTSLQIVNAQHITYNWKYTDRSSLLDLYFKRKQADDILMVKGNQLLDSFYANSLFWKKGKWYTSTNYILPGTKRAYLLSTGRIQLADITIESCRQYEKVGLVNAMLDLDQIVLPIRSIDFNFNE